jgi:hypothetical protein
MGPPPAAAMAPPGTPRLQVTSKVQHRSRLPGLAAHHAHSGSCLVRSTAVQLKIAATLPLCPSRKAASQIAGAAAGSWGGLMSAHSGLRSVWTQGAGSGLGMPGIPSPGPPPPAAAAGQPPGKALLCTAHTHPCYVCAKRGLGPVLCAAPHPCSRALAPPCNDLTTAPALQPAWC